MLWCGGVSFGAVMCRLVWWCVVWCDGVSCGVMACRVVLCCVSYCVMVCGVVWCVVGVMVCRVV